MNGFLNIDKPPGWTSHDVVAKIRGLLKGPKVGHAGTLDPQATGVLPICLGKATRLSEFLFNTRKEYRAVLKLGMTTDTQDADGRLIRQVEAHGVGRESVQKVFESFTGPILQVPPMYSAIKVNGQPLYKLARKGQVIDRPPREVTIYSLVLLDLRGDEVTFDVACSRGTYVRTLCADIGDRLGVGGCCQSLERRRCGPFRVEEAVSLEAFQAALLQGRHGCFLYGMEEVLRHLPDLRIRREKVDRVLNGVPIGYRDIEDFPGEFHEGALFRVTAAGIGLVALAKSVLGSSEAGFGHWRGPVFKVERVLISPEKVKNRDYSLA